MALYPKRKLTSNDSSNDAFMLQLDQDTDARDVPDDDLSVFEESEVEEQAIVNAEPVVNAERRTWVGQLLGATQQLPSAVSSLQLAARAMQRGPSKGEDDARDQGKNKKGKNKKGESKKRVNDEVDLEHLDVGPKLQFVKEEDPRVQWQQLPNRIQRHILENCPNDCEAQKEMMYKYLYRLFNMLSKERQIDVLGFKARDQFEETKRHLLEMIVAEGNTEEYAQQELNGYLYDTNFDPGSFLH
jgi:hypothetical protein